MRDEHPLIADIIANQPKDDREPSTRRLLHSCGHEANVTIWGSYRLEDRFASIASKKCKVCMAYDSWRHTGSLPAKPNAVIPKTKLWLFEVMMNMIESDDIQGVSNG